MVGFKSRPRISSKDFLLIAFLMSLLDSCKRFLIGPCIDLDCRSCLLEKIHSYSDQRCKHMFLNDAFYEEDYYCCDSSNGDHLGTV